MEEILIYYQSKQEKIWNFVVLIADYFQGKRYFYLLTPMLLCAALSLYLNNGFPTQGNIFEFFTNYIDNRYLLILDTLTGFLCLLLIIPTSLLWFNLFQKDNLISHLSILIFIPILFISGFIFAAAITIVGFIIACFIALIWLRSIIK